MSYIVKDKPDKTADYERLLNDMDRKGYYLERSDDNKLIFEKKAQPYYYSSISTDMM
jgi:hypothetical protein